MTHQVQLSDPAYERLKAQKKKGESFSDVVLRAIGRPSLLEALAKLPRMTDKEYHAWEQTRREMRALDAARNERMEHFRRTGKWP